MEPEAVYAIGVMLALLILVPLTRRHEEVEFDESDIDDNLMDDLLNDLRSYANIAKEVTVTRANGDVVAVKFRGDETPKKCDIVAPATDIQTSKLVWAEDGRHLKRETLNWGSEQ